MGFPLDLYTSLLPENVFYCREKDLEPKVIITDDDYAEINALHLGITPIYGSFVKSPCDCQPLQFHGHNFTVVRTSNQGSFVNVSTKLHTLAVTRRLFGPAGEKQIKTAYLGIYMEDFWSSENFA